MKHLVFAIALLVAMTGCNTEYVDETPAIAVGDKFYGALNAGDARTALSLFAPEFKSSEKEWPRLLGMLQVKYGVVSSAELRSTSMSAKDESPCFTLTYSVKRGPSASDETLFVCRSPDKSLWAISGHALTRLDTKQSISGGVIPAEVGIGVHVP